MAKTKPAEKSGEGAEHRLRMFVHRSGNILVEGFHLLGLFAIGASTVWAAVATFIATVRWSASISRPTACRCAS